MEKQYLQPQTYVRMIQELTATIGNLYAEIALQKTQYSELVEYTTELQKELEEAKAPKEPTVMQEVVKGE